MKNKKLMILGGMLLSVLLVTGCEYEDTDTEKDMQNTQIAAKLNVLPAVRLYAQQKKTALWIWKKKKRLKAVTEFIW